MDRSFPQRAHPAREIALSWSGGKDCAVALDALDQAGTPPVALLTTVNEARDEIAHHGVPAALLRAQADALDLPVVEVRLPPGAPNAVYESRMRAAFATPPLDTAEAVAFGDLFLADLRAYREQKLAEAGREALFPLWHRDTTQLAKDIAARFKTTVVSVDRAKLPLDVLGRPYDDAFLDALPPDVDPCGENGEFHTLVHDGPPFARSVPFTVTGTRSTADHGWCELSPGGPGG